MPNGIQGFQKGNQHWKSRHREYKKGWHHTEEAKRKISLRQKGIPESEEFKKKLKEIRKNQLTPDIKRKISESLRGKMVAEKHWNWKGGKSNEVKKRVNSFEWKQIRKGIYTRDNWTCQICGMQYRDGNGRGLDVHHIIPYRVTQDNSESNLIVLCNSCHAKEERKYHRSLKGQVEFSFI